MARPDFAVRDSILCIFQLLIKVFCHKVELKNYTKFGPSNSIFWARLFDCLRKFFNRSTKYSKLNSPYLVISGVKMYYWIQLLLFFRLLTWEVRRQICFMNGKNMVLRRDSIGFDLIQHFWTIQNKKSFNVINRASPFDLTVNYGNTSCGVFKWGEQK